MGRNSRPGLTLEAGMSVAERVGSRLRAVVLSSRQSAKVGLRNWRRARVAKRKTRSRRTYALIALLGVLAVLFIASLSYLAPQPRGQRLTITQLSAIAAQKHLVTA